MKKIFLTTVTYSIACLLGSSFYYTLYKVFQLNFGLGLTLITGLVLAMAVIIRDNRLLNA